MVLLVLTLNIVFKNWPNSVSSFSLSLETTFAAKKRTPSPDGTKGITIASAKYSSEDCATLVQYTIAIVEYTRLCGPLKGALEKLHELEREIEENERLQKESQEEVWLNLAISLVEYSIHSHQYMFSNIYVNAPSFWNVNIILRRQHFRMKLFIRILLSNEKN